MAISFSPQLMAKKFATDPSTPRYWALRGYGSATTRVATAKGWTPEFRQQIKEQENILIQKGGSRYAKFIRKESARAALENRRLAKQQGRVSKPSSAIRAGGLKIDFDKGTVTDPKTKSTVTISKYKSEGTKALERVADKNIPKQLGGIPITDAKTGKKTFLKFTSFENELIKKVKAGDNRAAKTLRAFRDAPRSGKEIITTEQISTGALKPKVVEIKTGKVISPGQFKLDRKFENKLSRARRERRQAVNQIIGGFSKVLTNKQKEKIYSSSLISLDIPKEFKQINKRTDLNIFEKEDKKRELLGLNPGEARKIGLFPKLTDREFKEISNTISIAPDVKTNEYIKFENKLKDEYLRIAKKPVDKRTNKEKALIGLLGVGSVATGTIRKIPGALWNIILAFVRPDLLVKGLYNLATDSDVRSNVNSQLRTFTTKLSKGDPDAFSTLTAEIIATLGIANIGKAKNIAKLSPNYVKQVNGKFILRSKPITLKSIIKKPFSSVNNFLKKSKPGQFKQFIKNPEIILKTQTVKSGAKPLSQQALLAGQEVTAVNAAADQLTGWLKRKQIIRKPIPGEADFPKTIKTLLNNFDTGKKLSPTQFARVNKWLKTNVAPNITLLERSLYADPASGLRISRLGISKVRDATFKDILRGNFKLFNTQKPQVLIFQNAKVAKFPKYLLDVEKKLKAEKKLTEKETNRLIAWQIETGSGKFKPIGSTIYKGGKELEVTLAPGEFIKRIEQIGFTFIKGKKVNFVTAEVWKPPKSILDKMKKALEGKLTDKQLDKLEKTLSKKLGRKIKVETPSKKRLRNIRADTPVLRIKGKFIKVIRRISPRKLTTRKPTTRKSTTRKPTTKKVTTRKPTTRKSTTRKSTTKKVTTRKPTTRKSTTRKPTTRKSTIKKVTTRKPTTRKSTTGKSIISTISEKKRLTFNTKLPRGFRLKYDFKYREGGKVKTFKAGLPLNKALTRATGLIDNTTARSMELVISGVTKAKDLTKRPAAIKKFRTRKTTKVLELVEKSKYAIDSRGEKRGLSISKKLKPKRKSVKRKK